MLSFNGFRNSVCGLPDSNHIQLDGSHRFGIGLEGIKIHSLCESLDLGYRTENILNAFFPISR